jgi:UDP-glucuronate 4-epimerase
MSSDSSPLELRHGLPILVTGAAGFIGSRVVDLLLAEGRRVVGLDNLNDAYDVRLKEWRLRQLEGRPGFEFQRVDICDREALSRVFGGPKSSPPFAAVINLAARAGVRPSLEIPEAYFETNVNGTLHLLELCRKTGVKKFVLASSSSLYGESKKLPYREDANTDHPVSPYAASKKAAELLAYSYHHLFGLDVTVLRYFTVYGPAGRPDMSPFRFVQRISEGRPVTLYGDGTQSRDFTYVDDVARGTIAGLNPLGFEVINLGSDKPVVLMDAIRLIEKLVGRKAEIVARPRHPADVPATWAEVTKARNLLGWEGRVRFEEGCQELIRWYRQNRAWAREIATDV